MDGLMQRHELLISSVLAHAARHHGDAELVSRRADGSLSRTNYAALAVRARKLAMIPAARTGSRGIVVHTRTMAREAAPLQ